MNRFDRWFIGIFVLIIVWMLVTEPLRESARKHECQKNGEVCKHINEWVPTEVQFCVPVPHDGGQGVG